MSLDVHFKEPTADYTAMFEQMEQEGVISTRGLKADAVKYAANALVKELKAQITSLKEEISALTAELKQYKSVRRKLHTPDLEQENDRLRKQIRTYEEVISRNNLWHFFKESRNKNRNRDDAR